MTENHSFTWSTRREGNFGYVLETRPDGSLQEFGPLPVHVVLAWVAARRRFIENKMKLIGGYKVPETTVPDPSAFH